MTVELAQVRGILDRKGAFLQGEVQTASDRVGVFTEVIAAATRWHASQERIWMYLIEYCRVHSPQHERRGLVRTRSNRLFIQTFLHD